MFDEVFESIQSHKLKNDFIYPFYKEYCISNIPALILDLLNVKHNRKSSKSQNFNNKVKPKDVNKIILFILDGFGLFQFEQYNKSRTFFKKFNKKGGAFPLTSIFPSQTTNALATLNTGLTPQEHGLFEYFIYLKKPDMVINTLSFKPMNLEYERVFKEEGFSPDILFKGKTVYDFLQENNIKSFCHMYIRDAYSPCSKIFFKGSQIVPSLKASDLVINLRKTIEKTKGPAYYFVHLGNLDTIAHQYGPQSEEYYTELMQIISLLENNLVKKIDNKVSREVLLMLTSDHGELTVDPEKTTYLNKFPELIKNLKSSKRDKPILPTGSPRDIFLHVKKGKLLDTEKILMKNLEKKAKIMKTTTAIKSELFGIGDVRKTFLQRVGDLMVLPYDNETIWFEHFKNIKFTSLGHHGGLSQNEMLVPFMFSKLIDLR